MILPTICLDAGHYGKYNRSPAVSSFYESDMAWKLHIYLKEELEAYGFPVRLTRETQAKDLGLVERGKKAEGCGLFLSIHANATGNYKVNEDVDYPLVYYPIETKGDAIDGKGKDLAELLAACIQKTMGTKQEAQVMSRKGSGNWDYLGVINGARRVGVVGLLLEHSFFTNTLKAKWLLDDSNLQKMAKAEAKVIAKYYGATKKEAAASTNPVMEWQKAAIADGYSFPKYGADGIWGAECESVAAKAVVKKRLTYQLKNLTKIVQKAVGTEVDGLCGKNTVAAIKTYQAKHGLVVDGCVGINTWKAILGI